MLAPERQVDHVDLAQGAGDGSLTAELQLQLVYRTANTHLSYPENKWRSVSEAARANCRSSVWCLGPDRQKLSLALSGRAMQNY